MPPSTSGAPSFGGMIAAASMSASAVKEGAGARTQVSNLVTWVATIVTLLFLTPVFTSLPGGRARRAHHPRGLAHHRQAASCSGSGRRPRSRCGSAS